MLHGLMVLKRGVPRHQTPPKPAPSTRQLGRVRSLIRKGGDCPPGVVGQWGGNGLTEAAPGSQPHGNGLLSVVSPQPQCWHRTRSFLQKEDLGFPSLGALACILALPASPRGPAWAPGLTPSICRRRCPTLPLPVPLSVERGVRVPEPHFSGWQKFTHVHTARAHQSGPSRGAGSLPAQLTSASPQAGLPGGVSHHPAAGQGRAGPLQPRLHCLLGSPACPGGSRAEFLWSVAQPHALLRPQPIRPS